MTCGQTHPAHRRSFPGNAVHNSQTKGFHHMKWSPQKICKPSGARDCGGCQITLSAIKGCLQSMHCPKTLDSRTQRNGSQKLSEKHTPPGLGPSQLESSSCSEVQHSFCSTGMLAPGHWSGLLSSPADRGTRESDSE